MAKLYFRYGVVHSAKTMALLACAHNYRVQGKTVLIVKPMLDKRFGAATVKSRSGLEAEADIVIETKTGEKEFAAVDFKKIHAIVVDECQFLEPETVETLRRIVDVHGVPCLAYGLRTDYQTHLFGGARRLMELADTIEEVKTTCWYCNRKGSFNLKFVDGKATRAGLGEIVLGGIEAYKPACATCYRAQLGLA